MGIKKIVHFENFKKTHTKMKKKKKTYLDDQLFIQTFNYCLIDIFTVKLIS